MNTLPSNWEVSQQNLKASILQSSNWAEFQHSLGRNPYFGQGDEWSWIGYERKSKGLRYLMIPYGPTIRGDKKACLDSVLKSAKQAGFDFVRLEPIGSLDADDLKALGGRQISEVDPQHTQLINLEKSEEDLRMDMRSGHRNPVNTAAKRGVKVYHTTGEAELPDFLRLMASTASSAGIKNYDDAYYQQLVKTLMPQGIAKFYVATVGGKKASISIVYDYNSTRSYAWAGNDQELNRKSQASVVNVWTMITDAKAAGMQTFDLWGVAPEDAPDSHKWAGISAFKRGFGGNTVGTLGTWDIPLKKAKYATYQAYRKLRGLE
jgi:lipid II:glycine glycyltransferase (peptidoglycan interpeptide bridge formation enzyme)